MLTARSMATSPLDVIRLTLELLSGGRDVPQSLERHFDEVLRAARMLSRDPQNPPNHLSAEAIHLAFELVSKQALRNQLEGINGLHEVDRERAEILLTEIELEPVHP